MRAAPRDVRKGRRQSAMLWAFAKEKSARGASRSERGATAQDSRFCPTSPFRGQPMPTESVAAQSMHSTIRLHPNDDVIIATRQLVPGTRIDAEDLVVTGLIPPGHKVATRAIAKGEPVKRY